MTSHTLAAHMGGTVTVDACLPCQAFWFDGYESLQLTPGSTLQLFRMMGEQPPAARRAMPAVTACPRCTMRLVPVEDRQRNTRFEYQRCPRGHGRYIAFFDFLREKDFVKPLSDAQLAELRTQVQTVNCSNCGAPVDLQHASACGHCGTPLSFFDMSHARALVDQLQTAEARRTSVSTTLPIDLLLARQEAEHAFPLEQRDSAWLSDAAIAGTVSAGVRALARWLGQHSDT
ncbi:MAG: zinc ribbon domain-containing protein [Acidobacteria bacterium]|nr:zinc ribbon domain-containing protein [Acidobacteriota bacterium]